MKRMMMTMKSQPLHMLDGWNKIYFSFPHFSQPRDNGDITHLDSFGKCCVSLQGHSHSGVDTACEGDVDEGHQDGDQLEQGEVLVEKLK